MGDTLARTTQDALADFTIQVAAAKAAHVCVICGEPIKDRIYTRAGAREYQLSGTCELCFEDLFEPFS